MPNNPSLRHWLRNLDNGHQVEVLYKEQVIPTIVNRSSDESLWCWVDIAYGTDKQGQPGQSQEIRFTRRTGVQWGGSMILSIPPTNIEWQDSKLSPDPEPIQLTDTVNHFKELLNKKIELAEMLGWTEIRRPGEHFRKHLCYKAGGINPENHLFETLPEFFTDLNAAHHLGEVMAALGCRDEWMITVIMEGDGVWPKHEHAWDHEFSFLQASAERRAEAALIVLRERKARMQNTKPRYFGDEVNPCDAV